MKVFVNYNMYDNTPILIAANSRREAFETSENGLLCTEYFEPGAWKEVKGLDYDTNEPCVIEL